MARARKLYYDITVDNSIDANVSLLDADRDGNTLDPLPALDGNADGATKRRHEISALFVPYHMTDTGSVAPVFQIRFMANSTDLAPYYTAGGTGTTPVAAKAGSSAVYVANPRIHVAIPNNAGGSYRGTLYVQRQHSLEC